MAVMEQETMPSTDDYQKAFLVFYPGETAREAFNAILRSAQDAASFLKLDGDQYDEFVRGQLHTTLDFYYRMKQAARAADPDLLGDDRAKSIKLLDHFRWCSNVLGADNYPETKLKEIYSVMRKIAAAIPDAVVSGENQLLFLQDTDAVVEAINQLWLVGVTWETNFANLLKFLESIGSEFKPQYEQIYRDLKPLATIQAEKKPTLSADAVPKVRAAIDKLFERAMQMLDHPDIKEYDNNLREPRMQIIQDALVALNLYGDSPKHEPLRCDLATILFYAAGHVDKDRENYCDVTDTEVTCVFNYLLKKNPQSNKLTKRVERKEPLKIPVHKYTPKLATFLRKFKPIAEAIAGPGAPLLFGYQAKKDFGRQMSANVLSTRAGRKNGANMFTRMKNRGDLEPRLVPLAAGVNKARHASVTEDRANAVNLTREEIADQHTRRGQNPPRESVADKEYGHRAEGQLQQGTEVRLHSLTRASELNDSFGTVLEYLPDKQRYRVELQDGETGLFRHDSLEDMSRIVTDLTDALMS